METTFLPTFGVGGAPRAMGPIASAHAGADTTFAGVFAMTGFDGLLDGSGKTPIQASLEAMQDTIERLVEAQKGLEKEHEDLGARLSALIDFARDLAPALREQLADAKTLIFEAETLAQEVQARHGHEFEAVEVAHNALNASIRALNAAIARIEELLAARVEQATMRPDIAAYDSGGLLKVSKDEAEVSSGAGRKPKT